MNSELDTTLRHLHRIYVELSHHSCPYSTCERRWLEWHNAGFVEDDLRLIIGHVQRVNRKREFGFQLSLRFGNLIGDLERAGDLLGEARAEQRKREHRLKYSEPPNKAEILRATGRPDTKPLPDPQQAKQVMEGLLKKGFQEALKEAAETQRFKP